MICLTSAAGPIYLVGAHVACVGPVSVPRAVGDAVTRTTIELVGGRHIDVVEAPEVVAGCVKGWWATYGGPR